ncbi:DUF1223 domain-containing protein [Dokdonia sp.]|uniref:DUF1223 domain-containing protein n=1 Tax=Dokdonia sp. TaxID=2024995 RepID=UPI003266626E
MRHSHKITLLFILLFQTGLFAQKTPTVIELFTSQGCSSCPPADALLEEIKNTYGADVITLSYHVDYWDYIGWKDPFATQAFTKKQYGYAEKFRSRGVYTPQAVINGRSHYTGSDKSSIYRVLKSKNEHVLPISITVSNIRKKDKEIAVDYTISDATQANELTFVIAINEKTTQIKRGENRNKTLKNTHIVIAEQTIHRYATSGQVTLHIPSWVEASDQLSIVAYATKTNVGIVSAITKAI